MAYATINDPTQYFHTQLYNGDGTSSNAITNDANAGDFQPDFLWIKCRSEARDHQITDSARGGNIGLRPNSNIAEFSGASTQFDSDGFTLLDGSNTINGLSPRTYVAWQWKANGGTTSSNTDGTITSTVQANTTAGFSIVTYTGTGSAGTVGHGLGRTVAMVITKSRDSASAWQIYHKDLGKDNTVQLNETAGVGSGISNYWGTSTPNSTVFGVIGGGYNNNLSGEATIAYCFAEIKGYSKFGRYVGTGNADGQFVYTGFKPAWLMIHRTDSAGENWQMFDNKRDGYNVNNDMLKANVSETEDAAGNFLDLLSNGFKLRETAARHNASGGTYIYMAFAENPLVGTNGIPATAR